MKKYKIFGILLYVLLGYQMFLLLYATVFLYPEIDFQVLLFIASFLFTHLYIFANNTKEDGMEYIRFQRRFYMSDIDEINDKETLIMAHTWIKYIHLFIALIFSLISFLFAFTYIIQHSISLYSHILNIPGISALSILLLTIILCILVFIRFIRKSPNREGAWYVVFKAVILQNFLIAILLLKTLSSIKM